VPKTLILVLLCLE